MKLVLAGPPEKVVNGTFMLAYQHYSDLVDHIDPDAKRVGARLDPYEEAYEGSAAFKVYINTLPDYVAEEYKPPELVHVEAKLPTKLPPTLKEGFVEFYNQHLERMDAELVVNGERSDQLPDIPQLRKDYVQKMRQMFDETPGPNRKKRWKIVNLALNNKRLEENPFYYNPTISNWGLMQKQTDNVSFLAAMRQRIKFTSYASNVKNLHDQRDFGSACWHAFRRYMQWDVPFRFDSEFYDKCEIAFQERRGDRSFAEKKGSLNRADPDYGILLTAKTQWKLKDRQFSEAKPLQPIMIHSDKYLFEWGPKGIYLLEMLLRNKPDYWFFYARKTPEEFSEWVSSHFARGERFAMNDLKGQDQSTQGWAVEFFSLLMQWFGFTQEIIDRFKEEKMTKEIGHKILAIMTDSGEIWTYLLNTTSATARECLMYDIPPGVPMANGGDDTLRRFLLNISLAYGQVSHMDPCEDKRYDSLIGAFCSFIVKQGTLTKDPVILLKRFLGKLSQGAGEDAVLGYAHLWAMNYRLGDKLYEVFDEAEMEAHQLLTRIMFNLKREGIKTRPDWSKLGLNAEYQVDPKWDILSHADIVTQVSEPSTAEPGPARLTRDTIAEVVGFMMEA